MTVKRALVGFEKFWAAARLKYEERFQYDRHSWKGADGAVRVLCSAHGWFEQIAKNHIHPQREASCPHCKLTDSWLRFISQAYKAHGHRFHYDRSSWKGASHKVRFQCSLHGWRSQLPGDHLKPGGCVHCSMKGRGKLDEKQLILRFKKVHGERYGYGNFQHQGMASPALVTCADHGDFPQAPRDHLAGNGCPKCSGRHRWTTAEFIERAKQIHQGKYTYNRAIYTGALNPITVTCPTHGDWMCQPSRHILRKDGCPKCSPVARTNLAIFLKRAKKRFGDRYDYSLVKYVDVATPVKIICQTHGVFEQPPAWHLANAIGCTHCTHTVSNKETAWLDSLNLPATAQRNVRVKIGARKRSVDAFDPVSKTCWEFWGTYWHGHPDYFAPEDIHPICKKTYGELYAATMEKRRLIQEAGYKLVDIWEHEYDAKAAKGTANRPAGRLSIRKPRSKMQRTAVKITIRPS